jgi:hypothetical protein
VAASDRKRVVGPGLSGEQSQLVQLTELMRDLGVKRFEMGGMVVEIHEAAIALALQPESDEPLEAGELEAKRLRDEEQARANALDVELHSA